MNTGKTTSSKSKFDRSKFGTYERKTDGSVKYGRPVIWDEANLKFISEELINWLLRDDKNIFLYRFAKEYDIDSRMFSEESYLQYNLFSENIQKAKHIIEQKLMEKGLTGEYQHSMTIFTLKNKYGWVDEVKHQYNLMPVSISFNILPESDAGKIPSLPVSDTPYEVIPPPQIEQPEPGVHQHKPEDLSSVKIPASSKPDATPPTEPDVEGSDDTTAL